MAVMDQEIGDRYAIYCADCMEVLPMLTSESVGVSIYSPPFPELYQYSNDPRDMSNCTTYEEGIEHYRFIVNHVYRLTLPGRLTCVHCMDLKKGGVFQRDFPGDIVKVHEEVGFHFVCRITIWKDPWLIARRTRMRSLMHKTIVNDSSMVRVAGPDYVLVFKKGGENQEPIKHPHGLQTYAGDTPIPEDLLVRYKNYKGDQRKNLLSHWIWRAYASPVWHDVRTGRLLPYTEARENEEEKHVCLARGSLVLTRDGHKPIEDVTVGSMVLTHRGRWRPVTAKVCNGTQSVIRTTAQGVADLRTTPEHRLWVRRMVGAGRWPGSAGGVSHPRIAARRNDPEWVSASAAKGSYVNLPLPPIEESILSAKDWWLIGRWLGDGHLDARNRPHISCSHEEAPELISAMGRRAGFVAVRRTATQIAVKDRRGQFSTEFTSILKRCGRGAAGKHLPVEVLTLNPVLSESLLSGYLSADGHFVERYQRWTSSSVSRPLLLGMAMVAQRARGVVASVYAGRPAGTCVIEGRMVNTKQSWVLVIPPKNLSAMLLEDGAWKKVRAVVPAGESEVWDIQVEEDDSFVAEGCVVHNCPLQLDVIERCLTLWSNPGDTLLTPFMGVGSEVYGAVLNGRRGIGIELKPSYYRQAKQNVAAALKGQECQEVWDFTDEAEAVDVQENS